VLNRYEGLFIFAGSLRDESLDAAVKRVRDEVPKFDGAVINTEHLGKRTFARPLRERMSGQYVRIIFDMAPERVAEFKARFRLVDDVFRIQIVRMKKTEPVEEPAEEPVTESVTEPVTEPAEPAEAAEAPKDGGE